MLFVADLLIFLALPCLMWRALRGIIPVAVLPVLIGLCISVAAHQFGFDKALAGPSRLGEAIGFAGVLILTYSAGLETGLMGPADHSSGRLLTSAGTALLLPFAVGFALSLLGIANLLLLRPDGVSMLLSAAAIGLCVAVSALPVLVGIVRELPLADRVTGNIALRIAALDDAVLWVGLAILLFLHGSQNGVFPELTMLSVAAPAIFVLMSLSRRRLATYDPPRWITAVVIGVGYLAAGAWATKILGLHEILGAYFAGVLTPAGIARRIDPNRAGRLSLFAIAPLFFGHRGLSIDGSVVTWTALGASVLLFIVAAGSKLAALHIAPPDRRMPARERTRLGLLLQCKGLMEIVAASILHQAGLIGPTAFAILVMLAIVSTIVTVPLFRRA